MTLNTGAAATYSGNLGEGAPGLALNKTGANTQILSGANSYTGLTTITAGALQISSAGAIGGNAVLVPGGGNAGLVLDGGIVAGAGKTLTINGGGLGGFFGALSNNSGNNEWAGAVTIGSAGTRIGVNGTGTLTVSGVIDSGASAHGLLLRLKDNTGGLILSGASTYLGDTAIVTANGVVQLAGGANRLPTGTRLLFGSSAVSGILDLNGQNQEVAGLSVVSGTTNEIKSAAPATLTVNTPGASPSTFSGLISGGVALKKTGSDTLILTASNTYSGITTVEGGVLRVNGAHSGAGLITASAGATLGGSGSLAGDTSVADAILSPGAAAATGGTFSLGNLSLAAASTLDFDLADPFSIADDVVVVGGGLTLAGVLNVNPLAGFDAPSRVAGDKWLLLSYGGPALGSHALSIGAAPALSSGLTYAIDIAAPGEVYLTVVPEAGTAGLLAAGLLALMLRMRRR